MAREEALVQATVDDPALTALLQAHREVNEEIRLHIARGDRVVGFALLVFGAGLVYGLAQQPPIREMFALIPMASFTAIWLFLDANAIVLCLGGYAKFLEEEASRRTRQPVMHWQRVSHEAVHFPHNRISPMAFVGSILVATSVVGISLAQAWLTFDRPYFWALAVSVAAASLLTAFALYSITGAFDRGYQMARTMSDAGLPGHSR